MAGVVVGHWLVTGFVAGPEGLSTASPLTAMPGFAPVTWLLQTLGLFFFAGGFAAARAGRLRSWKPFLLVVPFLGAWGVALGAGVVLGVPQGTLSTVAGLVLSPLWFLVPYLVLRLVPGLPPVGPLLLCAVALVAGVDAGWLPGWVAVLAAWTVPWALGDAVARGGLTRAWIGPAMVSAGAAAMALLITAGYPAGAVGIPGDGRSNLSPPSLFAVALAVTQIGGFLLLRPLLDQALRHPAARRAVARVNRVAMPVYLAHQSVLIVVTCLVGTLLPGLIGDPADAGWVAARMLWLPVLAVLLAAVTRGGRHGWGRLS